MRIATVITFVIALFLINIPDIDAGGRSFHIYVTTEVLPVVKYEILHREKNVLITEESIKKGYIDVHGAVTFSVLTNSRNGYVLTFFVGGDLFKEVEVFYDSGSRRIHGTGNEVHMPFEGIKYVTKELSFRFYISDIMRPGIYDWPVDVMINVM
jgi:hypothetical protein